MIFIFCFQKGVEYIKLQRKACTEDLGVFTSDLEAAKDFCTENEFAGIPYECTGILDNSCYETNKTGPFYLCKGGSEYVENSTRCIYEKIGTQICYTGNF